MTTLREIKKISKAKIFNRQHVNNDDHESPINAHSTVHEMIRLLQIQYWSTNSWRYYTFDHVGVRHVIPDMKKRKAHAEIETIECSFTTNTLTH